MWILCSTWECTWTSSWTGVEHRSYRVLKLRACRHQQNREAHQEDWLCPEGGGGGVREEHAVQTAECAGQDVMVMYRGTFSCTLLSPVCTSENQTLAAITGDGWTPWTFYKPGHTAGKTESWVKNIQNACCIFWGELIIHTADQESQPSRHSLYVSWREMQGEQIVSKH